MFKRAMMLLTGLFILSLACSLGSAPAAAPQAPAENQPAVTAESLQPGAVEEAPPEATDLPTATPEPEGTPPAAPVSINSGLASLNSYQLTFSIRTIGPDPSEMSTITVVTRRSIETDATHTHFTVVTVGEEPDNTENDIYQIGDDQCTGSDEDWSWASSTPAETEMGDLIKRMIDVTPLIDNPTYVGEETVNGILSNHFTFQVAGLGVESGAVVNINQGDYWLAADGQYIVRYNLVIETSMAANSDVLHAEISIELDQINQPVSIAFPQGCLNAALITPEP